MNKKNKTTTQVPNTNLPRTITYISLARILHPTARLSPLLDITHHKTKGSSEPDTTHARPNQDPNPALSGIKKKKKARSTPHPTCRKRHSKGWRGPPRRSSLEHAQPAGTIYEGWLDWLRGEESAICNCTKGRAGGNLRKKHSRPIAYQRLF